jgi:hypothetical protein
MERACQLRGVFYQNGKKKPALNNRVGKIWAEEQWVISVNSIDRYTCWPELKKYGQPSSGTLMPILRQPVNVSSNYETSTFIIIPDNILFDLFGSDTM